MATLTVTATHDYTSEVLVNITDITFNTSVMFQFATFFAAQFDNVQISQTVHITGDGNSDQFNVIMAAPGTFSAAGWTLRAGQISTASFSKAPMGPIQSPAAPVQLILWR